MDEKEFKKILDSLVKKGYLKKRYDPCINDELVSVTEKGKQYFKSLLKDPSTQVMLFGMCWNDIVANKEILLSDDNGSGLLLIINLLYQLEKDIGKANLTGLLVGLLLKYERQIKGRNLTIPQLLTEIYETAPKSWEQFIKNVPKYRRRKDGLLVLMGDILILRAILKAQKNIDLFKLAQESLNEIKRKDPSSSYIY